MKSSQKGYTLLFAVIVSVLLLSIAAFILSVSRKQFILSSSARDSIYAFYAADSGLECALVNVSKLATSSWALTGPYKISCGNNPPISVATESPNADFGTSTFSFLTGTGNFGDGNNPSTQSGAASCAVVTAAHYTDASGVIIMKIESRGYNIGWNKNTSTCDNPGARKVERALRYIQYQ